MFTQSSHSRCLLEGTQTTSNKRKTHNSLGQIIGPLKASCLPTAIGIVHRQSYRTDSSITSRGKTELTRQLELQPFKAQTHLPHRRASLHTSPHPHYHSLTTWQVLSYLHQLFHPNSQACHFVKARLPEDLHF